jgi:hypothetical protein
VTIEAYYFSIFLMLINMRKIVEKLINKLGIRRPVHDGGTS